jgi:hypothetical protein
MTIPTPDFDMAPSLRLMSIWPESCALGRYDNEYCCWITIKDATARVFIRATGKRLSSGGPSRHIGMLCEFGH